MLTKGFKKSESPDLLISIFTKSREEVNVYSNGFAPMDMDGVGPHFTGII